MIAKYLKRENVVFLVAAVFALAAAGVWYLGKQETAGQVDLRANLQRLRGLLAEDRAATDSAALQQKKAKLQEELNEVKIPAVSSGDFAFKLSTWAEDNGVLIQSLEFKPGAAPGMVGGITAQRYVVVATGPGEGIHGLIASAVGSPFSPVVDTVEMLKPATSEIWKLTVNFLVYAEEGTTP